MKYITLTDGHGETILVPISPHMPIFFEKIGEDGEYSNLLNEPYNCCTHARIETADGTLHVKVRETREEILAAIMSAATVI